MGDDKFIGGVAEKYGVKYTPDMKKRAYEIYLEKANERVVVFPWSKRLIEFFRVARVFLGGRVRVRPDKGAAQYRMYRRVARIVRRVITASEVTRQKPDPEIFLKAAAALGADPAQTLVFEDSLMGVRAAKLAGMKCIALTTSYSEPELYRERADAVLPDPVGSRKYF